MLAGKRTARSPGVMTRDSIAFAVARAGASEQGAEVVLTGLRPRAPADRARRARRCPSPSDVLELDVNSDGRPRRARATSSSERWGGLDGVLHAIAFAPADALGGDFLQTPPASAAEAFRDERLLAQGAGRGAAAAADGEAGGSVVGLDFDASVAWPAYDWMGVAKAALEAVVALPGARPRPARRARQPRLGRPARDARRRRHPRLRASSPTAGREAAPLGWDLDDPAPVADAVCFLLSDRVARRSPARSSTSTAATTPWGRLRDRPDGRDRIHRHARTRTAARARWPGHRLPGASPRRGPRARARGCRAAQPLARA